MRFREQFRSRSVNRSADVRIGNGREWNGRGMEGRNPLVVTFTACPPVSNARPQTGVRP